MGDLYKGDMIELGEDFMEKKKASERVKMYVKMMQGINTLHDLGYAHSDIKPDNIMIEDESYSNLRIIDLGLSTKLGDSIQGGSPVFMPITSF